jgi:indolepyruvate decarboxylase
MTGGTAIGQYLIDRLHGLGVEHVFGVPGDYVLGFFGLLAQSPLKVINTCDEQGAGFAADAYARLRGLGVVCITYCVGGLKVANTTAQAYAEKSPVVVISGAPGVRERVKNPLLHHKVRDFDTQLNVFQQFTVDAAVITNPEVAFEQIDRVLAAAMRYKRPVYIELPRDVVAMPGARDHAYREPADTSDPDALQEGIQEAVAMVRAARQPVIIAGVELHRFGLQGKLLELLDRSRIPVAATVLSKSVISEAHPCYLGVYEGAVAHEAVRDYVETSDCLLLLGAPMSDMDLGINTAHLDVGHSVYATSERFSIRHHVYEQVLLADVLQGLIDADLGPRTIPEDMPHPEVPHGFTPDPGRRITVRRLLHRLNAFITEEAAADTILIADVGDALFASLDLYIPKATDYLSPAYYTSLGFAVPAAIGAQMAAPHQRPLVIVGDGAFQMTGMELATIVRYGLDPIIIVLNNGGYTTERPMLDGPFNDILPWRYAELPRVLGAGRGFTVETEDDLERALTTARESPGEFSLLDVHLDRLDMSTALERLTSLLGKRVR